MDGISRAVMVTTQASLFCSRTAPEIKIKDIEAIKGMEGKEIFAQQKNLNFFQNKVS